MPPAKRVLLQARAPPRPALWPAAPCVASTPAASIVSRRLLVAKVAQRRGALRVSLEHEVVKPLLNRRLLNRRLTDLLLRSASLHGGAARPGYQALAPRPHATPPCAPRGGTYHSCLVRPAS